MSLIILTMISTFIILVISNLLQSLSEEEVAMGDQWELDAEDQMGDTVCICGKVVFVYVFVFVLMGDTVCICSKVVTRDVTLLPPTVVQLQVYEEGHFMIQCDICRDWLHGECVRVTFLQLIPDHESFVCPCKDDECVLFITMSL